MSEKEPIDITGTTLQQLADAMKPAWFRSELMVTCIKMILAAAIAYGVAESRIAVLETQVRANEARIQANADLVSSELSRVQDDMRRDISEIRSDIKILSADLER